MQTHGKWSWAAIIAPPIAVLGLAITVACSRDSSPEPTAPKRAAVGAEVLPALSAEHQNRLNAAKTRTRWVGDAHHAGMKVVIKQIADHRKAKRPLPKRGSAEYCAIMEKVGDATLAVLDKHRRLRRSSRERIARVRQDPAVARCSGSLAVFGASASMPFVTLMAPQENDPEVTGAYELYLDPMDAAVQGSDGSVPSVQSRVDAVLGQAISAGIPEGDLLALTSFAALAVSSAEEWNAFDWSANAGSDSDNTPEMSVFARRQQGVGDKIWKVVGADAGGCFSTVKSWKALKLLLGAPAWVALGAECGLRGALTSGGTILGML